MNLENFCITKMFKKTKHAASAVKYAAREIRNTYYVYTN